MLDALAMNVGPTLCNEFNVGYRDESRMPATSSKRLREATIAYTTASLSIHKHDVRVDLGYIPRTGEFATSEC